MNAIPRTSNISTIFQLQANGTIRTLKNDTTYCSAPCPSPCSKVTSDTWYYRDVWSCFQNTVACECNQYTAIVLELEERISNLLLTLKGMNLEFTLCVCVCVNSCNKKVM